MKSFVAYALEEFPLVGPGDHIAAMIVECCKKNRLSIRNNDVIVIAQKIFSKAEGRIFRLKNVVPSNNAKKISKATGKDARFVELVLSETKKVLRADRSIIVVEDKRGLVCINAGIDKSNVKGHGNFALLPEYPDQSVQKCRSEIWELTGKKVGVVMCDSYSRPFRRGQVNFAIGVAGIDLFRDYRGKRDLFGQVLKVKNVAVIDEIAAAAELLMGQGTESTPVVIIRGLNGSAEACDDCRTKDLMISGKEDLFRGVL